MYELIVSVFLLKTQPNEETPPICIPDLFFFWL